MCRRFSLDSHGAGFWHQRTRPMHFLARCKRRLIRLCLSSNLSHFSFELFCYSLGPLWLCAVILCFLRLCLVVVWVLVVSAKASDRLERLYSEMIYNVLMGKLHHIQSFTHVKLWLNLSLITSDEISSNCCLRTCSEKIRYNYPLTRGFYCQIQQNHGLRFCWRKDILGKSTGWVTLIYLHVASARIVP